MVDFASVIDEIEEEPRNGSFLPHWYKRPPMLAVQKETGRALALFPAFLHGLYYLDPDSGRKIRVTAKNQEMFDRTAWYVDRKSVV